MAKKRRSKKTVSSQDQGVPGQSRGRDRGRGTGASKATDRVARRRADDRAQEEAVLALWKRLEPILSSPESIGAQCRLKLQALRAQQRDC
jgi:hypothetical protein